MDSMFIMNYAIQLSRELEIFCQTFILHKLQHLIMSRPDRLKRQPTANTTPQSTPSFDPIEIKKQRTKEAKWNKKKSQDLWRKREKIDRNLAVAENLALLKNSQNISTSAPLD